MEPTMTDEQRKRMIQNSIQIAKIPSPREDYRLVAAPPLTDAERARIELRDDAVNRPISQEWN
jgi:hypothetical protein